MPKSIEHRILEWLMPIILTALLGIIGWMVENLQRISESLAVHEERLHILEEWIRHVHERKD